MRLPHLFIRTTLSVAIMSSPSWGRSGEEEGALQDLRDILRVQFKEGERVRIRAFGQLMEGEMAHSDERHLFLLSPRDSVEIQQIEQLWKRSSLPSEAVLTGAVFGGIAAGARQATGGDKYVGIAVLFGATIGTVAGLVVALFLPKWTQVFP